MLHRFSKLVVACTVLLILAGSLVTSNEYVASYRCRGHYFAGSQRGQETAASLRYGRGCDK